MVKTLVFSLAILAAAGYADAAKPDFNAEDPNLAYTNDYATDSAITCPDSLTDPKLKACLAKSGAVSNEDFSADATLLSKTASRSVH